MNRLFKMNIMHILVDKYRVNRPGILKLKVNQVVPFFLYKIPHDLFRSKIETDQQKKGGRN